MTLTKLLATLERRAEEAERVGSTAPVAAIYRAVLEDLQPLTDSPAPLEPEDILVRDRLLTVAETAERLSVSTRYVYAHRSEFPFTRRLSGGAVRFSEQGLAAWLQRDGVSCVRNVVRRKEAPA